MNYVYVLECSDKKLYMGCTSNLKERLERHNKGKVTATKQRLPVKLVAYFALTDKYKAFSLEKFLKSGSGREFLKKRII